MKEGNFLVKIKGSYSFEKFLRHHFMVDGNRKGLAAHIISTREKFSDKGCDIDVDILNFKRGDLDKLRWCVVNFYNRILADDFIMA